MGRLFFFLFFSETSCNFFFYCYGIVIVLNFLLIRHKNWKAFERRFIRMSNSYYGNGSVTGGNLENNRLQRVLLFPLELSKPAKVVQAATKKIRRKKRRRSTKHGPNLESCLSRTQRPRRLRPRAISKASSI